MTMKSIDIKAVLVDIRGEPFVRLQDVLLFLSEAENNVRECGDSNPPDALTLIKGLKEGFKKLQ